ncbi:phytanoyl-CoA dioxygenase family protein [Cohnella suwonensis]|uniref:Phytanoyl-CoA dioxygenase family protein n=1 Tax=Cohnella suwonensis TaxID=696072 RepID=A0ABW0LWK6_9BACL
MIVRGNPFSLNDYRQLGYSGPIAGLTAEEADNYVGLFFHALGQEKFRPKATSVDLSAWHHRHRWAFELATHPAIIEPMKQILGDDLVLWAMHFWYKEPGNQKVIPWHQDIHFWPMEPAINATAWMSLGWSVRENGCLRVIPGTHGSLAEHVDTNDDQSLFDEGLPAHLVEEEKAVDLEMSPGQLAFFNEALFHGSEPNHSDIPRVAFSVRYTTPAVRFKMESWTGNTDRIRTFLVSGEDRCRFNDSIRGNPPVK